MSLLRPTLNVPLLPPPAAPVVVVGCGVGVDGVVVFASFFDPQPAASTTSVATSRASGISLFTGPSEVLDCGTKTVADSTSHAVVAVVLRAAAGRLEVLLAGDALPAATLVRGESLEDALARAVDTTRLAHLEQLETRVLARGV